MAIVAVWACAIAAITQDASKTPAVLVMRSCLDISAQSIRIPARGEVFDGVILSWHPCRGHPTPKPDNPVRDQAPRGGYKSLIQVKLRHEVRCVPVPLRLVAVCRRAGEGSLRRGGPGTRGGGLRGRGTRVPIRAARGAA